MRHLLKTYRIEWAHRPWFDAIWYITASIDGNSDMLCASRIFIFILFVSVRFSVSLFFLCSLFRTWKVVNACICLVRMRSIGFCCRKNNAKFQKHVHRFNDWKSWTSVKYQKFCVFLHFEWCIKFFAPLRLSAVIPFSWPIWPLFKAQLGPTTKISLYISIADIWWKSAFGRLKTRNMTWKIRCYKWNSSDFIANIFLMRICWKLIVCLFLAMNLVVCIDAFSRDSDANSLYRMPYHKQREMSIDFVQTKMYRKLFWMASRLIRSIWNVISKL